MKTLFAFAAIAFAFCIHAGARPAAAQWPQGTSHEPRVTIEFGGLAIDREGLSDSTLVANDSMTGGSLLTSEQATDLGSAAGLQGRIIFPGKRLLETFELRGVYAGWEEDFQIDNNNLDSQFLTAGILQVARFAGIDASNPVNPILPPGITAADLVIPTIPLSTGEVSALSLIMPRLPLGFTVDGLAGPALEDFYDVNQITSRYQSDYSSVELMARRNHRPGVTWLFGPRFISVEEESQVNTQGVSPAQIFIDPASGIVAPGTLASQAGARAATRNSMIGLQLGLEYNMPITQDVYLQFSGRGGAFYNSMSVGRSASPLLPTAAANAGDFFSAQAGERDSSEAWLAEFSVRGYMDLIPNTVAAYVGFEGVFIDQLALAPANLVILDRVENSGEMFAKALSFGLKMNY